MTDAAAAPADAPVCGLCAARLSPGARFCAQCGGAVDGGSPARDPLIGATVAERYRILSRLGAGGMGAVYAVEHVKLGKVAALKLLHAELSRDDSMVRRFTREARAVSRLESPFTVSVFDYGRAAGLVFLVMELLRGRDLGDVVDVSGPLAPERVGRIVSMVATSLHEAHQLGIVHRDIKPQNVFLCDSAPGEPERVKVLDFGLAKLTDARDDSLAATHAGTILGTPYYMAPEQIQGESVDRRTDIYSLAGLAWTLLTGAPPYRHATALGVLHQHLTAPPPSIADVAPHLSGLDAPLRRALAKRPAERHPTAEAFASELADAIDRLSSPRVVLPAQREGARADTDRAEAFGETWPDAEDLGPATRFGRADLLGTREEFDRFARRLRWRRAAAVAGLAALAAGAIAAPVVLGLRGGYFGPRDREPNDDIGLAVPLAALETVRGFFGEPIRGASFDRDVYVVDLPAMHALDAEVTGVNGVDIVLEIADGTGRYIARSDGGGPGDGERVYGVRSADIRLFVVVRPDRNGDAALWNIVTPYELRVATQPTGPEDEREPNDEVRLAQSIAAGERVRGRAGHSEDLDVFVLPPGAGPGIATLRGAPGLDLVLERLEATGGVAASADAAGEGSGESLPIPGDAVSPTWLRVSARGGAVSGEPWELLVETEHDATGEGSR